MPVLVRSSDLLENLPKIIKKTLALAAAAAVVASLAFSPAAHAGPRLDKIMETKVIRVGTPGDYRPFAIKTDAGTAATTSM